MSERLHIAKSAGTYYNHLMIIIGEINDKNMAQEIIDELKSRNILAQYQFHSESGSFVLTVENENDYETAHDLYRVKLGLRKPMQVDPEWLKFKTIPRGEITYAILVFCVGLYVLSFFPVGKFLYEFFMINEERVMRGEIWRLFTPVLLHMNLLHILFNMLWFKDLGYAIEYSFGKYFLIKFILITAFISNLLQFFSHGPSFGGMSGVLYGMLGFIWVYKNLNDNFEYSLPKADIYLMIFWFFLCLSGVISMIANMAHAGGLVVGMLLGCLLGCQQTSQREVCWHLRLKYFFMAMFFLFVTVMVEAYKLDGKFYITKWVKSE